MTHTTAAALQHTLSKERRVNALHRCYESFKIPDIMGFSSVRAKPLMIYDGDCEFCRRWIARWRAATGDRVDYAPYQQVADSFPEIPRERFETAVQLIEPDGAVLSGAHAVFSALAYAPWQRWPLWFYRHLPGAARITEAMYGFVAEHRRGFSTLTRWLWGSHVEPPRYLLTRWLFLRLVGVIYFIAFVSLGVQILGLVGSNGILPAQEYLDSIRQRLGTEAYWRMPTLAWLNCSDEFLQLLCGGGALLSVLVVFRIAPAPLLFLLWVFYLSLYRVGQTFLSFQWDLLLLETGFLAIFFAPWKLWPRLSREPRPSRIALWLVRLLLFKLMFFSGVVKLLDDHPVKQDWHKLTALNYHYETQCIPNAVAWYAHQLPEWFQKFSVFSVFVIELGVPFLIFLPRRPRFLAFILLVFLQVLIILTGNYNFFNLLTLALCISLLDDAFLRRFFPKRLAAAGEIQEERARIPRYKALMTIGVACIILSVGGIWTIEMVRDFRNLHPTMQRILRESMRFQSINSYGLFRHMTTERPEIIVEGSDDGRTWLAYEFKWKPGDVNRPPTQVAPHQPRLDWQMWFAALGDYRSSRNAWFIRFQRRLLEGSPEVLRLLETNPFPDAPPRYIRAVLYDYRFTDWETRREQGTWWTRKRLRLYTPVLSLRSFRES